MKDLRLTDDEQRVISRLREHRAYRVLMDHLSKRLEVHKSRLVETTDLSLLPAIQGRARELEDIIQLLKKEV